MSKLCFCVVLNFEWLYSLVGKAPALKIWPIPGTGSNPAVDVFFLVPLKGLNPTLPKTPTGHSTTELRMR